MSFLSGLANIFHSIGGFFEGNDNNQPQPQRQPPPQIFRPTPPPQAAAPAPAPAPAQPQASPQGNFQPPQIFKPTVGPQNFDVKNLVNGTLAKAPPTQVGPAQPPTPVDRAITTGADVAARTGLGFAQGIIGPANWLASKLGIKALNGTDQGLAEAGKEVDQDQAAQGIRGTGGNDLYKGGQIAANVATLLPGAVEGTMKIPALVKAAPDIIQGGADALDRIPSLADTVLNRSNTATDLKAPGSVKLPDELGVGMKSANPNQTEDAAAQVAQKQAEAAATPSVESSQASQLSPPQPPAGISPQEAPPSGHPPVQPTAISPQEAPPAPGEVSPPNIQSSSSSNNVAQPAGNVNPQAPNAPNVQAGFTKELGTEQGGTHEVMQKDAMQQRALGNAQNTDLEAAIKQHSVQPPVINTPQDAFDASALMRRMYAEAKTDPASMAARNNLAQAIADYGSRAGQGTNVMADMTANLPPDAKANVITKSLMKLWGENEARMPADLKTLSGQSRIQSTLTDYLEQGEDINNRMAALQSQLEDITAGKSGSGADVTARAHTLGEQLKSLQLQSQIKNNEALKYYDALTPKAALTERAAQGARTAMLSGLGGRLNNAINVGGNSAYELLSAQIQGAIGRGVNLVTGGKTNALDTGLLNKRLVSGTVTGAKRAVAEAKNGRLVDDLGSTIWNKSGGSLSRADEVLGAGRGSSGGGVLRKAGNLVKAAVTAPRNIFGGAMKDADLVRLARQEGISLGKTGEELKTYTAARSYVPSDSMMQKAQELQDQVSHTNKNAFSSQIDKWFNTSKLTGNERGIGGLVKNAILPFAKFPATMLYNTITDRNIIADAAHLAVSAAKGDVDGVTKALARGIIDGSGGALGWHLAHMGLITNKDANGYSDSGLYLHLGNRYIPLGDIGVGSESMIGGASMALATASKGGNVVGNYVKGVGDTLLNTFKMAGGQSLVGADNQSLTALQNAVGGKETLPDAAATVGEQEASQFVPSATGDINAVLNHSPLNPTGEAALTKVTKGASGQLTPTGNISNAKDIIPSLERTFVNRIPVASQLALPRNPGTTAPDELDRITRGSHVGGTQQASIQQKQDAATSLKQQMDAGIPVYKAPAGTTLPKGYSYANTLDSAVQNGDYDNAVKGLQGELKAYTTPGPEHIPPSKIQAVKDKITQLGVAKDSKLSYSDMQLYNKTTLSEWRNMGNPAKDTYDPQTYDKLWAIDEALAAKGVAGSFKLTANNSDTSSLSAKQKYSAASAASGRGGSRSSAATAIRDNTIRSIPVLPRDVFTNLSAKPVAQKIPQIKLTPPQGLIKAHTISVSSPRGNYN